MASGTKPTVCIVESLGLLEEHNRKEGEIISRTLQLSDRKSAYAYVRTRRELEAVLEEFGESTHRYLHLSCHSALNAKRRPVGFHLTTEQMGSDELAELVAPHVAGRRVFLSSCQGGRATFASTLLARSECLSVLAPMNDIDFDDAAIFWTAFYHLMFKGGRKAMSASRIEATVRICASLVRERFRLHYRTKDGVALTTIRPLKGRS